MTGSEDLTKYVINVPERADYASLRTIPFFDVFKNDGDLTTVARGGSWLGCPKGTVLMRDGELGHDFFVLIKGCVEVRKGTTALGEVCQGELLGEMGAMLHEKRSADAVTREDCILFRLHVTALNNLPLQVVFPLMVHIYRITAKRLKLADKKLSMM
ncbi:cyclic nucleotide-binding domain-containing protein [Desulfovibrio ferrophilus]|uniref:Cyclic nucleotide-binding protein n=1 Tax=Desulfovibrio ferrophilus TaxID=241368 RepID=A0A2Z6AVK1_9BACT|nr:cyclic nucleotide-binding domain-containing protein [Desulfovibrio ferrophilus]BBD07261.1 cyclic nucleotide-binding protein [Desulfovibrio ferrophilus]